MFTKVAVLRARACDPRRRETPAGRAATLGARTAVRTDSRESAMRYRLAGIGCVAAPGVRTTRPRSELIWSPLKPRTSGSLTIASSSAAEWNGVKCLADGGLRGGRSDMGRVLGGRRCGRDCSRPQAPHALWRLMARLSPLASDSS